MMRFILLLFLLPIGLPACVPAPPADPPTGSVAPPDPPAAISTDTSGATVQTRFLPPAGFVRRPADSFAAYLRALPLKPAGAPVHYFNGEIKSRTGVAAAVVDMEIGRRDLQQCADAVIRLRAEYLWEQGAYDRIHFNFTNGFRADYQRWRAGERIRVEGNRVSWYAGQAASNTHTTFRKYLDMVFAYAGTWSLQQELMAVNWEDLSVGDVLVKGGSPGHAVIVVDMAVHETTGEKIYLLAQSYMPAQDIHILQNPTDGNLSPWYGAAVQGPVKTPEWTFGRSDLRRFRAP